MADVPGGGFEVGSAFVSVTPEAEDFQAEVEAIVGETDIVVQVPVVPDAAGFRARLEEATTNGYDRTAGVLRGEIKAIEKQIADLAKKDAAAGMRERQMARNITLQIATEDSKGRIAFAPVGGTYTTREQAMTAAKRLSGKNAKYCGDGLSVRYAGDAGTVYLCE